MEPNALAIRPPYYQWMDLYLKSFKLLHHRRQSGMSINPIAVSEMVVVATTIYLFDDIQEFVLIMSEMDDGFLQAFEEKTKLAKSSEGNKK